MISIQELRTEKAKAIKEKNKSKKNVIALIISTAQNIAIEDGEKEPTSEHILTALNREHKAKVQAIEAAQSRPDLKTTYESELEIIKSFMPEMMSESEIMVEVVNLINELKADGQEITKKMMGPIMKTMNNKLKGRANGKDISKAVTTVLSKFN